MYKRVLATIVALVTIVSIVVVGGSEVARAQSDPPSIPIVMGARYVPSSGPTTNGVTVVRVDMAPSTPRSTPVDVEPLPEIAVRRIPAATTAVQNQTLVTIPRADDTVPYAYVGDAVLNEAEIASLKALNELRRSLGLSELVAAADLSDFAESWAILMSETVFEHSTGDDSGYLFKDDRSSLGENIVWHSNDNMSPELAAEEFHRLWVESPGHYENMTNPIWTEVGVGLFRDSSGWWGVHTFSNG